MIAPLYGALLAVIFYSKTEDARNEWMSILMHFQIIQRHMDGTTEMIVNDIEERSSVTNIT